MKKALLTCILLMPLLCKISSAQKVYFSDTSNYWITKGVSYIDYYNPMFYNTFYSIADSSVVYNGKEFNILKRGDFEPIALVRDDTVENVVYITPLSGYHNFWIESDTNEFIFMDYNLNIGDTMVVRLMYHPSDSTSYHVVTDIDSILINNIYHKRFKFFGGYPYEFIEGVGSTYGPELNQWEWAPILACFKNQDTVPCNLFNKCNPDPIAINELAFAATDFELYPNPASGSLRIRYAGQSTGTFQLNLTDMLGREKRAIAFNNDATIDISALPPGIYFARILHNGLLLQTKKLVVAGPGRY
jgi:hypothetical protein